MSPLAEAAWAIQHILNTRELDSNTVDFVVSIVRACIPPASPDRLDLASYDEEIVQCNLLRDIFGNPFRPVAFSADWRSSDAVAIARTMYESRDFGAMPILADALQDAGCDNEDILSHCRDATATHVRGCWVCDLVLGKI